MRFAIIISVILQTAIYAQPGSDSLKAIQLNRQAKEEFTNKNYDKAIFLSESSMLQFNSENTLLLDADNLHLLAKIYFLKKSKDKAVRYFLRSINAYDKLKDTLSLFTVYCETGDYFFYYNAFSKALEYYQKAYSLASSVIQPDQKLPLLNNIGVCFFNMQEYQKAFNAFAELLPATDQKNSVQRLRILYHLTETCNRLNDYGKSAEYDSAILNIYRSEGNQQGISTSCNNLAFDYVHLKNYPLAIESFTEALSVLDKNGSSDKEKIRVMINIGICYQNENNFSSAIDWLKKADKLTKDKPGLISEQNEIENVMAVTYYYKNDLYNAELYCKSAIESAKKNNNRQMLQECYYTYSQVLKAGNDFIKALEYYEMQLALKDSVNMERKLAEQQSEQDNLNLEKTEKELRLTIADEDVRDLEMKKIKLEGEKKEKELDLLRKQSELEASEKERILQSLIVTRQQHEAEIRNREMKSLEQEKSIKDLQLKQKEAEKKEKEREITVLELEKEKQSEARKKAIYVSILFGLIGIIILFGLLNMRQKNKVLAEQKKEIEEKNDVLEQKNQEILTQNEQIVLQKDIIEEKNKSITDSIHYARRIQGAVLPPVQEIQEYFSDSFVLFRPRDIVSGDFYWGAKKGDQVVITAADCTGHGVPGAFMSMLGTAFLNEIVGTMIELDAAKILHELRQNVIISLRQTGQEGENKDGMDISLCIVNRKNSTLQFAGANNPMYMIRNSEIQIIKPDRMPIGIHANADVPFKNNNIDLKKGDAFYIFSDGIADQFGGPKNKKFKYSTLQYLLLENHEKPFQEQQRLIESAFEEWKGDNEQVDDLLMIGFRV
jgi:serine phosphatase RsbU (regulator of sigma subunit)